MTKKDLKCYRTNYNKKSWAKLGKLTGQIDGWAIMPLGVCDAIEALCKEVERLSK